jgi:tRNA(fMet)-specific endonuclease VapC
MEPSALLDTDILSLVLRKDPAVYRRSKRYLLQHSELTISAITRYEILRGLKAKRASSQLTDFDVFCECNEILPLTDSILVRSANIYADLSFRGQLIPDADIFIAATAIENGLLLVTRNISHFNRIPGLDVEAW